MLERSTQKLSVNWIQGELSPAPERRRLVDNAIRRELVNLSEKRQLELKLSLKPFGM